MSAKNKENSNVTKVQEMRGCDQQQTHMRKNGSSRRASRQNCRIVIATSRPEVAYRELTTREGKTTCRSSHKLCRMYDKEKRHPEEQAKYDDPAVTGTKSILLVAGGLDDEFR